MTKPTSQRGSKGEPALNARRTLIADLPTPTEVDVLQIWGSPELYPRIPLVADLLAKSKVDVMQLWASQR